jgi:type IV secretory pathway protease TraF
MTFERIILVTGWMLLLGILLLGYNGVVVNITDSAPIGLYIKAPGIPQRGQRVLFRPLIKSLAAFPGDTIRTTPEGTYVNGRLQPDSAIPEDTQGWQPYRFGTYTLGHCQYWALGTGDSLDSRYWGPVSCDDIATPIIPLWTSKK